MSCCDPNDENEAVYQCMKHQVKVHAACAKCKDPDLFCKFRPSCMIHFMEKELAREKKQGAL